MAGIYKRGNVCWIQRKKDEERKKEIGIHQKVEKPLNRSDLAEYVRKVLERK